MKKYILSTIIFMLVGILATAVVRKIFPKCEYLVKGDETALKDVEVLINTNIGYSLDFGTAEEFFEKRNSLDKHSGKEIIYEAALVTATGNNEYFNKYSQFEFHIEQVITGEQDILEKDIPFYIDNTFYTVTNDYSDLYFKGELGYTEETHPWFFNFIDNYYGMLNVPKKGHHYLIVYYKVQPVKTESPVYFINSGCDRLSCYFDFESPKNDKIIDPDTPCYMKYYLDNQTFFYDEDSLKSYMKLKESVFEYYGVEDLLEN